MSSIIARTPPGRGGRGRDGFGDGEGVAAGQRRIEHLADLGRVDRQVEVERRGRQAADYGLQQRDRLGDRGGVGDVFAQRVERGARRPPGAQRIGPGESRLGGLAGGVAAGQGRAEAGALDGRASAPDCRRARSSRIARRVAASTDPPGAAAAGLIRRRAMVKLLEVAAHCPDAPTRL